MSAAGVFVDVESVHAGTFRKRGEGRGDLQNYGRRSSVL
jgi:hypothetical protein